MDESVIFESMSFSISCAIEEYKYYCSVGGDSNCGSGLGNSSGIGNGSGLGSGSGKCSNNDRNSSSKL